MNMAGCQRMEAGYMIELFNAAGYFGAESVAAAARALAAAAQRFRTFYSAYALRRRLRWVKLPA